ncbi:hypothetical protein ACS0TY_019454 [Phlomoides rotata]
MITPTSTSYFNSHIEKHCGIPISEQTFVFNEQILDDDLLIHNSEVTDQSQIQLSTNNPSSLRTTPPSIPQTNRRKSHLFSNCHRPNSSILCELTYDKKNHLFFENLKQRAVMSNVSKSLCIGARVGKELAALKRVGVEDSLGIDLVPYPPLVIKGDFHHHCRDGFRGGGRPLGFKLYLRYPFHDATFDFEFSNIFDHTPYSWKFVREVERTLKPGEICVLHVLISRRADKYSANDLYNVKPLEQMFTKSDLVEVRGIDGFGLDTEVRKREKKKKIEEEAYVNNIGEGKVKEIRFFL